MAHSVVHFAVYADDPDRAMAFYRVVFGWRFEPWGPPGFWRLFTGPDTDPGVTEGALSKRTQPRADGSPNAFRCTLTVPDCDAAMAAVVAHGGAPTGPVADIPGVGKVGEFLDPEGNRVCVMQYAEGDPRAVR